MKVRKQIIALIIILLVLLLPTVSKAAMAVKSGTTAWKSISVSDAFDECKNLATDAYSTLGTNSLDPHLTLNSDWGAVAYLTMSVYGSNSSYSSTSTTGNETGVKDFGKTYTYTAGAHETGLESASNKNYRQSLIDNKNTKYVELLKNNKEENPKGLAITELTTSTSYCTATYPMLLRTGVLGFDHGPATATGGPSSNVTFRPVIWNSAN